MKTLIIFYSYTGNTKRLAQELATREAADIVEIKDLRRPGILKSYSLGCFAAMATSSPVFRKYFVEEVLTGISSGNV